MLPLILAWLGGLAIYALYVAIVLAYKNRVSVVLPMFFIGALTASQFIATKLADYGLFVAPAAVPIFVSTVGVLDALALFFGRRYALDVVRVGFFFQAVVFFASWLASALPKPAWYTLDVDAFLAPSARVAIASLTAYIASSTLDVYVVTRWPRMHILLRAYTSSYIAMFVDTVVFITLAFGPHVDIVVGQLAVKYLQIPLEAVIIYVTRRVVGNVVYTTHP